MVLSGQILVSSVHYDFRVVESMEVIEFTDTERDEEDKKENDVNFRIKLANKKNISRLSEQAFCFCQGDLLNQNSEVTTPPPQSFNLISYE